MFTDRNRSTYFALLFSTDFKFMTIFNTNTYYVSI